MASATNPARRRFFQIEELGVKEGCRVSYGISRHDEIVESITQDGLIKLIGIDKPLRPGQIWSVGNIDE